MRVACIGNMNNNMFALVRYLRGDIEADLLLVKSKEALAEDDALRHRVRLRPESRAPATW